MIEAALGNFEDFISEMGEDVIVLGHTHIFRSTKVLSKLKNMYYINSGTWIDLADHVSLTSLFLRPYCLIQSFYFVLLCTFST